jgi:hypothetical protein
VVAARIAAANRATASALRYSSMYFTGVRVQGSGVRDQDLRSGVRQDLPPAP